MQDIPDIDGDRIFGIRSFSVRLGQQRVSIMWCLLNLLATFTAYVGGFFFFDNLFACNQVFWICIYLLEMAYTVAMVFGATSSCLWSKCITVGQTADWCHSLFPAIIHVFGYLPSLSYLEILGEGWIFFNHILFLLRCLILSRH